MEAQRIVVNGRNLPVHRWKEINEEQNLPNEHDEICHMIDMDSNQIMEFASKENPQDSAMLTISEKSTVESLQADSPMQKNFFNPPERLNKSGRKAKQPFKNKDALNQLKARYKTELCRHFKRTGYCPLEAFCQFAHGNEELRKASDPLPGSFGQQAMGAVHSNYKTSACRNWAKTGQCKYGPTCSFFHDISERRKLTDPLPNLPADQNMPPQLDKVFVSKDAMQQNAMDFGAFNSYSQQNAMRFNQMGYGNQQLNGLDEIAVQGGFDPSKYLVAMPQPMNANVNQGMVPMNMPVKSDK